MRKLTITLAASVLAMSTASIALADDHRGKRGPDANGDGEITLEEAQAHSAKMFARADADGNGQIDKADRELRQAERFAKIDANGDGEVTQAEMQAAREARYAERKERKGERAERMFARADKDGSGGLSAAEMDAAREARKARMTERGGREARQGRGRASRAMAMLRRADANGDKVVTRAEFGHSTQLLVRYTSRQLVAQVVLGCQSTG